MNIRSQKWLLSRHHLIKGAGVSLALPFLNSMSPMLQAGEAKSKELPRRSVFMYIPNGVNGMTWQCSGKGRDYELSRALKPLERHKEDVTVFSGLHHPQSMGTAHECAPVWLTGQYKDAKGGTTFRNTISCDQLIAEKTSLETRIPSLELSIRAGSKNGDTLAYSRDGVPLPAEENAKNVFNRLFGVEDGGIEEQRAKIKKRQSILDAILGNAKSLKNDLGSEDKIKLDEYLQSVREIEKRTMRLESWLEVPKPKVSSKEAAKFKNNVLRNKAGLYYRTIFDLITLALRTDQTRVVTYMNGTEGVGLALPEIGVTKGRHNLSHHNGKEDILERLTLADNFIMKQFSYFLDQLRSIEEGEQNLLDRTMVLCGSGMSYGHSHANGNLPIVLAGGKGLGLKQGQHIDYNRPHMKNDYTFSHEEWRELCRPKDNKARLNNVFLTMIQKMNIPAKSFVDSLGPVAELG